MACLRLTFPEKDQPTVIALTGARLTIGRLPFNTIQIIDRTISGFHAELISEHGHYRLHDRGSSNGTFVNGQKVSDYHLNESCTITFGTVEAQFSPEDIIEHEEAETFPSRGEVNSVRQENVEMRATVAALREEIETFRRAQNTPQAGAESGVSREEFDQVVVEREALKEAQLRQEEEEINRLKTDLAILKRDRVNLQLAYDAAQRDLDDLRRRAGAGMAEPAFAPIEAAAMMVAQADETIRIELPKASVPGVPRAVPVARPAPPAAAEPLEPAAALKADGPFTRAPKPVAPTNLPKPPSLPSALPAPKAPGGMGGGPRGAAAAEANSDAPAMAPTTRLAQRPFPAAKSPAQPTAKLAPAPKPATRGTRKLEK